MPAELEAKFRADGPAPLEWLASEDRLADAELDAARMVDELDRYLDTADGRLSSRRWACRLREREGTTRISLKGPHHGVGEDWMHHRPELEGPATASFDPADWPHSEARNFLEGLTGGAALVERFHLRQRRTERAVREHGRLIGTLTLDIVAIVHEERRVGELFIVELETAGGDAERARADLERLGPALAARPGLRPDSRTKLDHALELLGSA
jgi:inorganic triphosphatase YgiF